MEFRFVGLSISEVPQLGLIYIVLSTTSVRSWPNPEAQLARLSVSFGEISWLGRGNS
jgi:hypothetical protein